MNNFDNKIKKIKTTIDDIRLDIDSMKIKNEKSMAKMLTSISNLSRNNSVANVNSNLPSSRSYQENTREYKTHIRNTENIQNNESIQNDYFKSSNLNRQGDNTNTITILTNFTQPSIRQTDGNNVNANNYISNSNYKKSGGNSKLENSEINLSRNITKSKINKPSIPYIPQPLKYSKYSNKTYTTPTREPTKYQDIISESPKYNFDYTNNEPTTSIKSSAKKILNNSNIYKEIEAYDYPHLNPQQNISTNREHHHHQLRFNTEDFIQKSAHKNESVSVNNNNNNNFSKTNFQHLNHSNFKEQKSYMDEYLPVRETSKYPYNTITFEQEKEKLNLENENENSMQNFTQAYLTSHNSTYGNVNYEVIIQELTNLLGNTVTPNELPLVLKEYIHTFKQYKLKDEFIDKLSNLYATFYGETAIKKDIKVLWRWIKDLIHFRKHNEVNISDDSIYYKSFCENIIKEYELRDLNGLKEFMNNLITKNIKNSKRVDRIKKLLFSDTQSNKETEF